MHSHQHFSRSSTRQRTRIGIGLLATLVLAPATARAAAGDLDASFGTGGKQTFLAIGFTPIDTLVPGGTPGTRYTITIARRRGIPVVIVEPDGTTTRHHPA